MALFVFWYKFSTYTAFEYRLNHVSAFHRGTEHNRGLSTVVCVVAILSLALHVLTVNGLSLAVLRISDQQLGIEIDVVY